MGYKIYLTIWLIGLISGVSVMLTGATLNFWLAQSKVDIAEIGFFALVALPYSINFIWSPILDTITLPWLAKLFGQRLSWIILLQSLLSMALYCLSFLQPPGDIVFIAILAILIALISSTNDNLLNALRVDILETKYYGQSAGVYIVGYRIGMMMATAGVIFLSKYISWQGIYQIIAAAFVIFSILLMVVLDVKAGSQIIEKQQPAGFNLKILIASMQPIGVIMYILLFLVLYRIADYFIATMINPFVIDLKFTTDQIAMVGKFSSSVGTIIGGILGSYLMMRIKIIDALYYFGIIHTSAHLLLALQAAVGNNLWLYFITII
jgi:PAT family beta-lactamase induction signal transducer AmpG